MTPEEFERLYPKAIKFAIHYHGNATYSQKPYVAHCFHVQQVLERFGYHPYFENEKRAQLGRILVISAILHDVVEDTDASLSEIYKEFGKDIAKLVYAVTNEKGVNRKERHKRTYPKIKRIPNALILKLADRIANIESCFATKDSRINMYRKEHEEFKSEFKDVDSPQLMWEYLERLML